MVLVNCEQTTLETEIEKMLIQTAKMVFSKRVLYVENC